MTYSTFSSAVSTGIRFEGLEDESHPVAAEIGELVAAHGADGAARRAPPIPDEGRVQPSHQVEQGPDFPDPEGPAMAMNSPPLDAED